jgi:hypothetical protein
MPFLWFANLYAVYSLRMGKTVLNFNVNVNNVFNVSTATMYYPYRNVYGVTVPEDQILSKNWELEEAAGYIRSNAFGMKTAFLPPISARVGVRFGF